MVGQLSAAAVGSCYVRGAAQCFVEGLHAEIYPFGRCSTGTGARAAAVGGSVESVECEHFFDGCQAAQCDGGAGGGGSEACQAGAQVGVGEVGPVLNMSVGKLG